MLFSYFFYRKRQQELEQKLRELEEQEAILEKESSSNTSTNQLKDQPLPTISSNQPQLANATTTNNNPPTTSQSTTAGPDSGNDHNYNSDDTSAITNTLTENNNQQLSVEDLKRIQYQQSLLNKNKNKPTVASIKPNEIMIDNCSMTTSSSGFGSLTADSAAKLIEQRKKEILKTFGIESSEDFQLNPFTYNPYTISSVDSGIISTQSSANYYNMNLRNFQTIDTNSLTISDESSQKPNSDAFKKQQKLDLLSYLNGQIDQDEYKRRLSANLNILNTSNITKGKDMNQLFGLELFDESDNLRDKSIEKLIGISLQNINSMTLSQVKSNFIHSPSSSNDTLNDQDEDSSFNNLNRNNNNNNNNNNNSAENDESEDEDISRDLLISLLNNRQSKIASNNSQQLIEMKKQFIQSQLDSVRRQKEQLNNKNIRLLNSGLPPQPPPPQSKMHQRLVNELNSHELSTIKEVDTPKSERNFKLTSNKYKNKNDSSIDLSTSLESVTQLSNEKSSSSSTDSITTSLISSNKINKSSSSSTPISTQTPYHNPQLLDINLIRKKQKELFNMSLFESSSSSVDNSSLISPNNTKNKNLVQYAAKIYDSLSSTNLSISAMNNNDSTLNYSLKQKVAFKTESTSSIDQTNYSTSNNNSSLMSVSNNKLTNGKTWFDILASEEDNLANKTNQKQDETILSQHPLSDTSSEEEEQLENTFNNNGKELEKTLQPVKYSPPTKQNNSSLSMQSLSSASTSSVNSSSNSSGRTSGSGGMFDKFLKNYTSQTCAASVMDEPEISFVSTVNSSTTNSPHKNTGGINILVKNASNTTSSSYTSCNETASTSFSNNSNLIQFQQKQLSKKFANMSPIETNSLNNQNNPKLSMTNSTLTNFTLFEQTSKINENEEEDNKSTKSSLILLSPNKIYNEKSTSLVHGLINDDDDDNISQSFIEGALQAPFEFNKFKNYRDQNDDYLSDSLVSFEQHELSQLTQTTIDQQNLNKNSSRCSSANSSNQETTIENNNLFLSNLTAEHTQNISKMFDKFKEKINNENGIGNNKKFINYSTPKIAITKSYQSSITNVTNYELEGEEDEEDIEEINSLSKNFAKNMDTSAVSSSESNNSSFMSQDSSIFKKPKDMKVSLI
jgi:hypothetical protein